MVVAVGIAEESVSGVKPAVAPGLARCLRIGIVAVVHGPWCIGAQDQLPDPAVFDNAIVLVDQAHLDAGTRPPANIVFLRIGTGNQRSADFGHVEQREEIDAEALAERLAALSKRHDEHHAKLVVAIPRARRLLEEKGRHRAEQEGGGDLKLAHLIPEGLGAEMADHADRASNA